MVSKNHGYKCGKRGMVCLFLVEKIRMMCYVALSEYKNDGLHVTE